MYNLHSEKGNTHYLPHSITISNTQRCSSNGRVVDARGQRVNYYPEVPSVLKKLTREGYDLGVASRTSEIEGAYQLLDVLGWDEYFKYKEIYPGSKVTHFNK